MKKFSPAAWFAERAKFMLDSTKWIYREKDKEAAKITDEEPKEAKPE